MNNKLLILSLDALNARDLSFIRELPYFSRFFSEGSYVESVDSIYPTVTYACHTSIITGTYPKTHGIYNNEIPDPSNADYQNWFWHRRHIKVPTLFDAAKRKGLTTANVLWPVMAGTSASIDYNIPEIWPNQGKNSLKLYLKNIKASVVPFILRNYSSFSGIEQPQLDDFVEAVALDIWQTKFPDLMTVHLSELDAIRHRNGLFGDAIRDSLIRLDHRVGHFLEMVESSPYKDSTNIILLGDHGGNEFSRVIYLNRLFYDFGLLKIDENKQIISWSAYASTSGGSCQIYLRDPEDTETYSQVFHLLSDLLLKGDSPIKNIFTKDILLDKYHLDGPFSFIVEAQDGYIFRNSVNSEWILPAHSDKKGFKLEHGFLPTHENLKTLLIAKGPDIAKGNVLEHASLVDEGPTFARLLHTGLPHHEGKVLKGLLS